MLLFFLFLLFVAICAGMPPEKMLPLAAQVVSPAIQYTEGFNKTNLSVRRFLSSLCTLLVSGGCKLPSSGGSD